MIEKQITYREIVEQVGKKHDRQSDRIYENPYLNWLIGRKKKVRSVLID